MMPPRSPAEDDDGEEEDDDPSLPAPFPAAKPSCPCSPFPGMVRVVGKRRQDEIGPDKTRYDTTKDEDEIY